MKFAEKGFTDYWKIIKLPTYVSVAWVLAGLITSKISFSIYQAIFSPSANWALTIAVFAFIGWTAVKDHKETIKIAAWAGALSGAISGFIGAVTGLVMFYLVPDLLQYMLSSAAAQGIAVASVQQFMVIGMYIGLVTGPLISGVVGAILSAIAAWIAKKV